MTDAQIHQIEYRHHKTRDLSPVATSMPSPDSVRRWDSRIRAWVRHPHADRLSESVCYQVFPNGQAAMAWRYWDQKAAERADGSRGRPLVSRVLVGQANLLTPHVAVALCLAGPTELVGPMPGEVPDGTSLPTISGAALDAIAREKTPELDQDALKQPEPGLQALVAATLADPATPLAISIRDVIIQKPLRESVQYPLIWGLYRITGRLLGSVGRGWSFSTFELPLGETDPLSLPAIVFRQAQDGAQAPPARYRKETKVRPLSSDALNARQPYAGWVDFAGLLVAEYKNRGGDGLDQFIVKCCGNEGSLQARLQRVGDELREYDSPLIVPSEPGPFVGVSGGEAPASESAASESAGPSPSEAGQDLTAAGDSQVTASALSQPHSPVPDGEYPEPARMAADDARREPDDTAPDHVGQEPEAAEPAVRAAVSQPAQPPAEGPRPHVQEQDHPPADDVRPDAASEGLPPVTAGTQASSPELTQPQRREPWHPEMTCGQVSRAEGPRAAEARQSQPYPREPDRTATHHINAVYAQSETRPDDPDNLPDPQSAAADSPTRQQHPYRQAEPAGAFPAPPLQQHEAPSSLSSPPPSPSPPPSSSPEATSGFTPAQDPGTADSGEPVDYERPESWRGRNQFRTEEEWLSSLSSSKERHMAPPLGTPDPGDRRPGGPTVHYQGERLPQPPAMSQLLKQLELEAGNNEKFDSTIEILFQMAGPANDPSDWDRSWEVICDNAWYDNISQYYDLHTDFLAYIFRMVVIPALVGPVAAEGIARWALRAPARMIDGLLAAARDHDPGFGQAVMNLLEPVLAVRWMADNSITAQWDDDRLIRAAAEFGSGENRKGKFGLRRWH